MGEKLEDLQQFYPDRMTSRILGMGDVLSLIEKAEQTINEEDALRMTEKMKKAEFDFNDFLDQMDQMKKMGGLSNLLSMIPGVGNKMQGLDIDDSMMDKTAAIIYSMTKEERANPKIINASRKKALDKIQLDELKPSSRKYPYINFKPNREIGNDALVVENLTKTIDGVKVLDNISFLK